MLRKLIFSVSVVMAIMVPFSSLSAQSSASSQASPLRNVGITQLMNHVIPLDLVFRDETGSTVHLGDYFGKRPVVLSLVYFNCPFICTEVLNGELRAFQGIT